MTTSATPSSAGHVVPLRGFVRYLLTAVLTLAPLAGCNLFHADFPVAVGNRMPDTVSLFANGQKIGDVGSNLTATFAIEQSLSGSVVNQGSPTPVAQVTFSARDMTTGVLSAGASATLLKDVTTYVDVAPCVATGGGFASPCVSVSSTNGATTGPPAQVCTFSLSQSNQSIDTTGGTGSVTVTTSNGCAWSATSNASWVTVVSGASGTGTGVVVYQVAANTTGQPRSTSLSIAGQTLIINQSA